MKRDEKGRFTKDEYDSKGYKFSLTFPSLTTLIYWIFIGVVILPWAIILERFNALKKIPELLDNVFAPKDDSESPKKKWHILLNKIIN